MLSTAAPLSCESQLIPALKYLFHILPFLPWLLTYPSLFCDSHTKSPPAAGVQEFLSLILQHGVALLSTSATPQKSGCTSSHFFCDMLVSSLLPDVFVLLPALLFFIPPVPPCPPSSRTSGEAAPSVLLQTCVKLSFSQHSQNPLTLLVKSLRCGLFDNRNFSWVMELTKPDFLPGSSIPWMPLLSVQSSCLLSTCSFVLSSVLTSVPLLTSVLSLLCRAAGAAAGWVWHLCWRTVGPHSLLEWLRARGTPALSGPLESKTRVFHKICKNFTFIPLPDLFKYVLWVKKSLEAAGCGEDRDWYLIYLDFLEKLWLKKAYPCHIPKL